MCLHPSFASLPFSWLSCSLQLDSWGLYVQALLGLIAFSTLIIKRFREVPRRPLKVWCVEQGLSTFRYGMEGEEATWPLRWHRFRCTTNSCIHTVLERCPFLRNRFFDTSKQALANVIIHFVNVFASTWMSGVTTDKDPCTWLVTWTHTVMLASAQCS